MKRKRSIRGGAREGAGRHLDGRIYKTSSQEGLQGAWTRATFIIRKDHVRKLKALALKKRQRLKEVLDEILRQGLSTAAGRGRHSSTTKNGKIKAT